MKHVPGRSGDHRSPSDRFLLFRPFSLGTAAVVCLALGAGGASRLNLPFAATVEVAALALTVFAVFRAVKNQLWKTAWPPLCLLLFIVLIPILQLLPVPGGLWAQLPSRALPASVLHATGLTKPWMPVTITPGFTERSGLSLAVPFAVFIATLTLRAAERRAVVLGILAVTLLGLLLGAVQVASGDNNAGYIYSSTSFGSLVGFFANRNHEATLLVCALPLVAAIVTHRSAMKQRRLALTLGGAFALIAIAALAVVKSRAGILLFAPSLIASLAIIFMSGAFERPKRAFAIVGMAIGLVVVLVGLFAMSALIGRFQTDNTADPRFYAAGNIFQAALHALPIGTGLGSFDNIYRSIEPISALNERFLNHAHDDYLEVFLETGLFGVVAFIAFIIWWVRASLRAWLDKGRYDRALAQAGSTIAFLVMLHSTVDYPMRTLAISAVFAFACGLLVPPWSQSRAEQPVGAHKVTGKFNGAV